MKRFTKVFITLFIVTFLTSCIRVETVIKVNKDGSGTITEIVMFSKAFTEMMRSFGESFGDDSGSNDGFSMFDEKKLMNQAVDYGEGVKYQSGKEVSDKDWEGYSATYAFSDITKIRINTDQNEKVDANIGGPGMKEDPIEEDEDEFYYFGFEKGNNPKLIINRTEIDEFEEDQEDESEISFEDDADSDDMGAMGKEMMKMFEGMKFNMSVIVDGKISNTNASYANGSKITLVDINFGEVMKNEDAFKQLSKDKPSSVADMKAMMEKFDGLKLELEQPVEVSFR